MADIKIGVSGGVVKRLKAMGDGTHAEVFVSGGTLLLDSSGQYSFSPDTLASKATYDSDGNQITLTYGPDMDGRYFRQTSTWQGGLWQGDSAWEMVTP